jgi:hypothetical protein
MLTVTTEAGGTTYSLLQRCTALKSAADSRSASCTLQLVVTARCVGATPTTMQAQDTRLLLGWIISTSVVAAMIVLLQRSQLRPRL